MEYYSYWLHSKKATMNVSVLKSADGFLFMYSGFLRKIHAIFLILLFVANFYFFKIDKKIFKQRLLIASWMFLIIPFYWVVILKTNGRVVGSAFMAAFPVMFISLGLPLNNIIIDNRKKILRALLMGLAEMKRLRIVHRDIKPENIIISTDLETIKIIDFGLATIIDEN